MQVASLVIFLSFLLGNMAILEQPLSSCLPKIEPFKAVLDFTRSTRTVTWLSCFAAKTAKPLQLWHTHAAYAALRRKRPRGKLQTLARTHANRRFSGKKLALKASQVYTYEFAEAVAQITAKLLHRM